MKNWEFEIFVTYNEAYEASIAFLVFKISFY